MKLAYFSCHAILEYDELRLFEALNIDYFSFGSYVFPTEPVDPIRPKPNVHNTPQRTTTPAPRNSVAEDIAALGIAV
jgi:hypothetical protein